MMLAPATVAALLLAAAPVASTAKATSAETEKTCADDHASGKATPATSSKTGLLKRGTAVPTGHALTLGQVLATPASQDGKEVLVEGTVRRACERRGCWMELSDSDKGPGIRVTFKDYGFFVPLDSAGSRARVVGTVKHAQLSDELAEHYRKEGATVPTGADGRPSEIQLVASGVELRRP